MARTRLELEVARRQREHRRALGMQIRHLREDAGVRQAALATAAGMARSHLSRIEAGTAEASLAAFEAVAVALGADLQIRVFPGAGVPIRDRYQARIVEHLLRLAHPRWRRVPEVVVFRPVRGVVDLVLHDPREPVMVATEVESGIRRVEQQLRWHNLKAEGLRQGSDLPVGGSPVSQLLVLRDTAANRRVVETFRETFAAAYSADPEPALRALTDAHAPWPGNAILWARIDGGVVTITVHPMRRRVRDWPANETRGRAT